MAAAVWRRAGSECEYTASALHHAVWRICWGSIEGFLQLSSVTTCLPLLEGLVVCLGVEVAMAGVLHALETFQIAELACCSLSGVP